MCDRCNTAVTLNTPTAAATQNTLPATPNHGTPQTHTLSLSTHTASTYAAQRGLNQHQAPHMSASGAVGPGGPKLRPMFSSRERRRSGCRHRRCQHVPGRCSARLCSRGQPGGWTGSAGGSGQWWRPGRTAAGQDAVTTSTHDKRAQRQSLQLCYKKKESLSLYEKIAAAFNTGRYA